MNFAELVIFVDGVGYSLAARSTDEMFIKKQCILWYLLLKIIFRLFKDMLWSDFGFCAQNPLRADFARSAGNLSTISLICHDFLEKFLTNWRAQRGKMF